jgi:hypothetical protein
MQVVEVAAAVGGFKRRSWYPFNSLGRQMKYLPSIRRRRGPWAGLLARQRRIELSGMLLRVR